jgi:hypothetical protein
LGKSTSLWKIFQLLAKGKGLAVFAVEQCVICITITDLRSLAFKAVELNHFPHTYAEGRQIPLEANITVGSTDNTHN